MKLYQKIGSKLYILIIILAIANVFAYKILSDKKLEFERFMTQVEISENNGDIEGAIRVLETKEHLNQQSQDKLNLLRYKLLDTYIANNDYDKQISLSSRLIQSNPNDENLKNIMEKAKSTLGEQEKAKKKEEERIAKEEKAKEDIKNKYGTILANNYLTDGKDISDFRVEVYENTKKEKSFYVVTKDKSGNVLKIFNPTYPNTYKKGEGDIMEINIARFDDSSQYYILIGVKDKNYYDTPYNQSSTSKRKYYFYKVGRENLQPVDLDMDHPFYAKNEDVRDGYRVMKSGAWSDTKLFDDATYIKATSGPSYKRMDFERAYEDVYKLYYEFESYSDDLQYSVKMNGAYVFENGRFKIDTFSADMR